jgi:hypothetical protein
MHDMTPEDIANARIMEKMIDIAIKKAKIDAQKEIHVPFEKEISMVTEYIVTTVIWLLLSAGGIGIILLISFLFKLFLQTIGALR